LFIDLHFHAVLSKRIGFSPVLFLQTIEYAKDCGLNALAITNHFNTPDFIGVFAYLDRQFPYSGIYYDVNGIKIIPGMEVNVKEGPHYVVLGRREDILAYYSRFLNHMTPETYPSTEEFLGLQQDFILITILAHPFRPNREITRVDSIFYPYFDALELNARDLFFLGNGLVNKINDFSRATKLPVIAGSDTHHYYQLGSISNEFHSEIESIKILRQLILSQQYTIHLDENINKRVAKAREAKQAILQSTLNPQTI
jgi:histidinol phosphatase-like PHP family hydrolase